MPPAGSQPQNQSPDSMRGLGEDQERLANENIAAELSTSLEMEFAHKEILEVIENASPQTKKKIQRLLVELDAKGGRLFIARKHAIPNIMKAMVDDVGSIRREILVTVLGAIGKKLDQVKWEEVLIGDKRYKEIKELTKWIKEPPDPKRRRGKSNPLYDGNDPNRPKFVFIDTKARETIDNVNKIIDRSDPIKKQEGEKGVKYLRLGLAVIERIDPGGAARYQFEKERGKEKDILIGPGRIALAGVLTILAVISTITVLRKIINKQDLSLPDAFPLLYAGLALKVAGIDLFKGKDELQNMVDTVESIHSDERFQAVVQRMSRKNAADAAKSFYQIAKGKDEQKKALLSQALTQEGVSRETLKSFAKERSPLFTALAKDNLSDIDRKIFLKRMQTLHEQKRDIYAIIAVIKHTTIYSINEL